MTIFNFNGTNLQLWDLSGKESMRKLWEKYYDDLDAMIYILDSTNLNVEKSIKILNDVLKNPMLLKNNIPILILINKIEVHEPKEEEYSMIYKCIDYSIFGSKPFLVKAISAYKEIGLVESIKWLMNLFSTKKN